MVQTYAARAKWLGSGRSPRVLAGVEARLRLEKHRHKRTGESGGVFFSTSEQVAASSEQVAGAASPCSLPAARRSL